jgi:hypothetical protein
VAFLRAPHNPVGESEAAVHAGVLALRKARITFGKRAERGSYVVSATVEPGSLPMDVTTRGFTLTLGVPAGETMATHDVIAPPGDLHTKGTRVRFGSRSGGTIAVSLRRRRNGTFRLLAKARRVDLRALDSGARDLTVALVVGDAQFVETRLLRAKGKGGRALALKKGRRA